ncbi:MAG: hypothetical protein HY598_02620 [Candidatus Omnitrophica bacterium]|nr:hypothetical protein [Candidatus Omnitrophota bacterium]
MWRSAVTRRRFLHVLLGAIGVAALRPFRALAPLMPRMPSEPLSERLGRLLPDPTSAAVVGHAYLDCVPAEADRHRLVELMSPRRQRRALAAAPTARLQEWFHQRRRRDFEMEHTVLVQGWMLSVTEARLCALVALRAGRSA